MNKKIEGLRDYVYKIFENSTQVKYWEHTKRVYSYSELIGNKENASMDVLRPAVLLHDIGITIDASYQGHIKKSLLLAKSILTDLKFQEKIIPDILTVIGSHNIEPGKMLETIEEQILYDCDFLEVVGVFGSLRWIGTFPAYAKDLISSIDLFLNIHKKCVDARGSIFFTKTARDIGDTAMISSVNFFNKVKQHIHQFEVDSKLLKPVAF